MAKKKKHIVLVEDEQTLANLIEIGLKKAGYSVQSASNGKKGLILIEKSKPDLVLLDIMLPGLGGFDILEMLHRERVLPDLPVIIISNSGEPIEIERATKFGVRDYLIKVNFNPNEVIEKVNRLFESEKEKRNRKTRQEKAHKQKKQVLLVEDDTILADTLERKFIQKNTSVHKAPNAKDARRILQAEPIDIILLDLILPDVDGFKFLEELKAAEHTKDIPVMIISNLGQKEEIERGLKAGAIDYIIKADTVPAEIFKKVEAVLTKRSR